MLRAFTALIRAVVSLLAAVIRAVSAIAGNFLGRSAIGNQRLRNFSVAVVRPDDLLVLTFEFQNLSPIDEGGANARLVRNDTGKALIIVHFPPQSIVEEASIEVDETSPVPELPIEARISGESRLVFRVPDSIREIPFTLDALLDWSRYKPYLAPVAQPPPFRPKFGLDPQRRAITSNPRRRFASGFFSALRNFLSATIGPVVLAPKRPDEFTALEIPYRLFLSPNEFNAWAHARGAIEHGGRTELWHTRLGVAGTDAHPESPGRDEVDEYDGYYRTLRAIWSPDYNKVAPDPFVAPLAADDRRQLVALTSEFERAGCAERVIKTEALMLTSLGAWMNVRYAFDHPEKLHVLGKPDLDLVEWRHRMSFGRDHYVRVVHKGYLFPFGHRAVHIEVSERKFEKTPDGSAAAAYIRKRQFVVVQQPEKSFGETGLSTDGKSYDRMMPFKTVRIATLITPNLEFGANGPAGTIKRGPVLDPQSAVIANSDPLAFWIQTKNETVVPFHLIGTDEAGHAAEFSAPLIFVFGSFAFEEANARTVGEAFMNGVNDARRRYDLNGQKVAFAPPAPDGDTTFETSLISMGVEVPSDEELKAVGKSVATLRSEDQPRFYPTVVESIVGIPAAQKLLGKDHRPTIRFSDVFLKNGFNSQNAGQVFAELGDIKVPGKLPLTFPADKSGGVVTPNFDITGLSRSLGPVGGNVSEVANLNFKPADFFPSALNAKILGSISLAEILMNNVTGADKFPKLISTQLPGSIRATFDWQTTSLQSVVPFVPESGAKLSLHTESITPLQVGNTPPASPTLHVEGRLTNFQFNLFKMIIVPFKEFAFVADTGKKLDVTADVGKVEFGGPLKFINVLADMIPPTGFKDPPSIDVGPTGIKVGYSLALPTISSGLFSIQHVKFSAGLNLPFILAPVRLRFAFSERHDPFMVSIYGITGGGFVGLAIGLDGVEQLEASFEVGGSLALNLVVAKGAVFIMLGIHFLWEKISDTQQRVVLAGYIRAGGAVEVLGLVTVSIEFYMELGYISSPSSSEVHGEASLTVEVEIAFFSKSVSLSVEKDLPAPKLL